MSICPSFLYDGIFNLNLFTLCALIMSSCHMVWSIQFSGVSNVNLSYLLPLILWLYNKYCLRLSIVFLYSKQHFQIGAYFIGREPKGLSIHGRGSLTMQQLIRKCHSCIYQMTSCKIANAREVNLWMSSGGFFLGYWKISMKMGDKMERKWWQDW
jgi:hypothetical protein